MALHGTEAVQLQYVDLPELVGACVEAANRACFAIQQVQQRRQKESDTALGAQMKDRCDPRTYVTAADLNAQAEIVNYLRPRWPGIQIIAEEGSDDLPLSNNNGKSFKVSIHQTTTTTQTSSSNAADNGLRYTPVKSEAYQTIKISVDGSVEREKYDCILLHELCIFIDPLDGTREFVEGRLLHAQTLIGIAWRGRPIVGIVGLPFHEGDVIGCSMSKATATTTDTVGAHDPHGILLCGIVGTHGILMMSQSGIKCVDASTPLPSATHSSFQPYTDRTSNICDETDSAPIPRALEQSQYKDPGGGSGAVSSAAIATCTMGTTTPIQVCPTTTSPSFVLAASVSYPEKERVLRRIHPLLTTVWAPQTLSQVTEQNPPVLNTDTTSTSCRVLPVGGCGNKIIHMLTGAATGALFNLRSSLWDSCALEALVTTAGGRLTTILGFPIIHQRNTSGMSPLENKFGVFATWRLPVDSPTHDSICARFRADPFLVSTLLQECGYAQYNVANTSAESSTEICRAFPEVPTAVDIARDIEGQPLRVEDLSEWIFGNRHTIVSYTCPESAAVRYKQSHCCRLQFQICESRDSAALGECSTSAFYKRAVLRELPHAVAKIDLYPYKILRDVKSLGIETQVIQYLTEYDNDEHFQFQFGRLHKLSAQSFHAETNPIDSRFGFLLKDFSPSLGWTQKTFFNQDTELRAALRTLAEWHAFFWQNTTHSTRKTRNIPSIWHRGGYWHEEHQPANQLSYIETSWNRFLRLFGSELKTAVGTLHGVDETLFNANLNTLAESLKRLAPELACNAHIPQECSDGARMIASNRYTTILHGDPKASNFFFRRKEKKNVGININNADTQAHQNQTTPHPQQQPLVTSPLDLEVGVIDFQWTGYGFPGTDVAYCIATCVNESMPLEDTVALTAVMELVEYYHNEIVHAFVRFGVAQDARTAHTLFPLHALQSQFLYGWLDFAKTVIADHWKTLTPDLLRQRQGKMVFNAYNKSMRVAMWFVKLTCDLMHQKTKTQSAQ